MNMTNLLELAHSNAISLLLDNYSVIDKNGEYIAQNRSMMENITGGLANAAEIDLPSWLDCKKVMKEGKRVIREEEFRGKYYLSIKQPIYQGKECLGIIILSFDIIKRKQLEEKLKKLRLTKKLLKLSTVSQQKF